MTGALHSLLAAAVRAPSGDNTQPWRFVVDEPAGTVAIELDPTRDPSPMNAGQRMARIALGAALENLYRTADRLGWAAAPAPAEGPALAAIRLEPPASGAAADPGPDAALLARATNRRPYDGRPVPDATRAALMAATPPLEGTRTAWVVGPDRLAAWAELIGRADGVMFGEPAMRRAFLANVRFDAAPGAAVDEGLSLGSLELSAADRAALRVMRRLPDGVLRVGGASRVFAAKAKALVAGASGLCLVAAPDDSEATDLAVGRAMQRAWLALTERGLAAQPMMSLPVLANALDAGAPALVAALGVDRVSALRESARALAPELNGARLAWVMRFGFAPAPTGRTGRRPLATVTRPAAVTPGLAATAGRS
jgi:nitroreductase